MASSLPTSWPLLAHLRKRGQKPAGMLFVTDHHAQRRNLEGSGAFALFPPQADEAYLVAGLDVLFIADRNDRTIEAAQVLATARPRLLTVQWRGGDIQRVLP